MNPCLHQRRPARQPRCAAASVCRGVLFIAATAAFSAAAAESRQLDIAFVGQVDSDAWHGARQGITEANAQGRFLGLDYELTTIEADALPEHIESIAVIADLDAAGLRRLAERYADIAVFNVSSEEPDLRANCQSNLLHTIPSAAMREAAIEQWRSQHPAATVQALAWHEDFEKYAAGQLNRRYAESASRPMNDVAWAAWAAVKVVSDQVARSAGAAPAALLTALKGPLAFDGQKGVDMSFRETGQLRQNLLLVEDDVIVGEAPVRGVAAPDDLDSLGLPSCQP
ncbi:MAG: hypothetical protein WD928_16915 [Gammaproteobacteria bacterium]